MTGISRRITVALVCMVALCSAVFGYTGSEENFMESLIDANMVPVLLEEYDSVMLEIYRETDDSVMSTMYVSDDVCAELYGDFNFMVYDGDNWFYFEDEDGMHLAYRWFVMDKEEKEDAMIKAEDFSELAVSRDITMLEELETVEDFENGMLLVVTRIDSAYTPYILVLEGYDYPEEYYSSDIISGYIVDADDLEILCYMQTFDLPGDDVLSVSAIATYDASCPETLKEMIALADGLRAGSENMETIRVIYGYGTDDEEIHEISVDPELRIVPVFRSGYSEAYMDPEMTEVFEGGIAEPGCTIYVF